MCRQGTLSLPPLSLIRGFFVSSVNSLMMFVYILLRGHQGVRRPSNLSFPADLPTGPLDSPAPPSSPQRWPPDRPPQLGGCGGACCQTVVDVVLGGKCRLSISVSSLRRTPARTAASPAMAGSSLRRGAEDPNPVIQSSCLP